jgi:hypothetical protein
MVRKNVSGVLITFIACSFLLSFLSPAYTLETRWETYTHWSHFRVSPAPVCIAIDSSGKKYVAGSGWLKKYDGVGNTLASYRVGGINDIMVDPSSGIIYAAKTTPDGSAIYKFDSNLTSLPRLLGLETWGGRTTADGTFMGIGGIAVDSAGNFYATDILNNRVQKFDSNGTFITKWGATDSSGNPIEGSGNGQFKHPKGIGIDSAGNVYVADGGNNRIQKFDSNGTFLAKWGERGSGDRQFNSPNGLTVDHGDIYVADTGNHRIQKFDSNGALIAKWGSQGSGDNQFNLPNDVAVWSNYVYVADTYNGRIMVFKPSAAGGEVVVPTTTSTTTTLLRYRFIRQPLTHITTPSTSTSSTTTTTRILRK